MNFRDRIVDISKRKASDVLPNPRNPKIHGELQNKRLTATLGKFGKVGVLFSYIGDDGKEYYFDGNGRQGLSADEEWYVARTDLTQKEVDELVLVYDPLAGLIEWHKGLAEELLSGIEETDVDINAMLQDVAIEAGLEDLGKEPDTDLDSEPAIDQADHLAIQWNTRPGQIWLVASRDGKRTHRLGCGDSEKAADVERLLAGAKPRLMVTDPPYGVEYEAEWRNEAERANGKPYGARAVGKVQNDNKCDWSAVWKLAPSKVAYIWHAGRHASEVQQSLINASFAVRSQIIWAKNNIVVSRGAYHWKHEPCWYAVKANESAGWIGDRKQSTLWEIPKPQKSETGHSTQKPLECMARPIRNHKGDVYEPFLGSGTTLIAAENLHRTCYANELSPGYVAVALQRYKDTFGIQPILEQA